MNIGRNDPCPCGSGKKFKKCCIHKYENSNLEELPPTFRWTEEIVKELETNDILIHLANSGVPINPEKFEQEIRQVDSVNELFNRWVQEYDLSSNEPETDFTYLGIKFLAERLAPDHLLIEQIDDLMQEGYGFFSNQDKKQASHIWFETWEKTLEWCEGKPLTDITELDELTERTTTQFFSNWVQDFEMALTNAERSDGQFAEMKIKFVDQFLERFPDSDAQVIHLMITAKAESLFFLEKYDEAEAILKEHSKEDPDNPWTYVRWGDLYNPQMKPSLPDKDYAISLYKKALDRMDVDYDREAVESRLEELKS